jgi:hypothetical protein
MSSQQKVINRYRQIFPNETLRETSARTGIQITRVFRLLSGKRMRVEELEAFERAIHSKLAENPDQKRLASLIEEALAVLGPDELGRITDFVERKVLGKRYARQYGEYFTQNAIA